MKTPDIQNAIKLVDFCIEKINMDRKDHSDKMETAPFELDINLGLGFVTDNLKAYNVYFDVQLNNSDKTFDLSLRAIASFETKEDISDEFKNSNIIKINSPAIAFPYVRSFITTFTSNAGIRPVILPAYNFTGIIDKD